MLVKAIAVILLVTALPKFGPLGPIALLKGAEPIKSKTGISNVILLSPVLALVEKHWELLEPPFGHICFVPHAEMLPPGKPIKPVSEDLSAGALNVLAPLTFVHQDL